MCFEEISVKCIREYKIRVFNIHVYNYKLQYLHLSTQIYIFLIRAIEKSKLGKKSG